MHCCYCLSFAFASVLCLSHHEKKKPSQKKLENKKPRKKPISAFLSLFLFLLCVRVVLVLVLGMLSCCSRSCSRRAFVLFSISSCVLVVPILDLVVRSIVLVVRLCRSRARSVFSFCIRALYSRCCSQLTFAFCISALFSAFSCYARGYSSCSAFAVLSSCFCTSQKKKK